MEFGRVLCGERGQRVAAMRARRSSRSASGISIVNGRSVVSPAGLWTVTAMWVLLFEDGVGVRSERGSAHQVGPSLGHDPFLTQHPRASTATGDASRGKTPSQRR